MTKEAKDWLKKHGFLIKNAKFNKNEIRSEEIYNSHYDKSKGSMSSEGFVLFYTSELSRSKKEITGTLHIMSNELNDKIFAI
tara:strand:- start:289 stop:534 length:246 start_codon:yes stop_codon:yes gene_type:complete